MEELIYILDLETNGLTLNDMEITQVAYLKVDKDLNILDEFSQHYYTDNLKDSANITGLTPQKLMKLSEGVTFDEEEYKKLIDEINHGIIIGHNISFDRMAIDSICYRMRDVFPNLYLLDSMPNVAGVGKYKSLTWAVENLLDDEARQRLKERFGGEHQFHDALFDIHAVREVLLADEGLTRKRLNNYLKTVPWRGA